MEQTNEVKVAGGAALHVASGAETEAMFEERVALQLLEAADDMQRCMAPRNEITRANQF